MSQSTWLRSSLLVTAPDRIFLFLLTGDESFRGVIWSFDGDGRRAEGCSLRRGDDDITWEAEKFFFGRDGEFCMLLSIIAVKRPWRSAVRY